LIAGRRRYRWKGKGFYKHLKDKKLGRPQAARFFIRCLFFSTNPDVILKMGSKEIWPPFPSPPCQALPKRPSPGYKRCKGAANRAFVSADEMSRHFELRGFSERMRSRRLLAGWQLHV
jgi:hypothetical protein